MLILQGLYWYGSDSTRIVLQWFWFYRVRCIDCFDYVLFVKVLLLGDGWVSWIISKQVGFHSTSFFAERHVQNTNPQQHIEHLRQSCILSDIWSQKYSNMLSDIFLTYYLSSSNHIYEMCRKYKHFFLHSPTINVTFLIFSLFPSRCVTPVAQKSHAFIAFPVGSRELTHLSRWTLSCVSPRCGLCLTRWRLATDLST